MGDDAGSAPAANSCPVEAMMKALAEKHINTNFDIDTSPRVKSRASNLPELVIARDDADQVSYVVDRILEQRRTGSGAACVTRTRDPIITNDVLYRLS